MKSGAAIALTMIVTFALTYAVLVGHRSAESRPPTAGAETGSAPDSSLAPVQRSANVPPPKEPADAAMLVRVAPGVLPAAGIEPAKSELPIQFNYRRSVGDPQRVVATLFSKSERRMALEISVVNASSGRALSAHLDLEPMRATKIGVDDGLDIEPGDRVILHNPDYNDYVEEVRAR